MAKVRATRLVHDLRQLEARVEAATPRAGGRRGLRRVLLLEMLGVLNGTGAFERVPQDVVGSGGLSARIARRLSKSDNHTLARAVYENNSYGVPIESYIGRGLIHPSEWDYLYRLSRSLGVSPAHRQDKVESAPAWMIDVDESHQSLRVWIREAALQDMLLAAMESYLVPAGSGKPSTETYGIVFGAQRMSAEGRGRLRRGLARVDINVERVCIQHRAKGAPSAVVTDWRSEETQLQMAEELFPFWELLGDFHTHPFRTLGQLYSVNGWNYSRADERENINWCDRVRASGHRPRVALILAITRAGRRNQRPTQPWRGMRNVVRAMVGKCHCFIAAYRIRPDGHYSSDALTLKCPHLMGH